MPPEDMSERQRELKEEFVSQRDYWPAAFDQLLRYDPDFFDKYLNLSTQADQTRNLAPKVQEFVRIVYNNTPAIRVDEDKTRQHIRRALNYGATFEEVMEVLQIVSTVGVHSVIKGVPTLTEEASVPEVKDEEVIADKDRVRDYFIEKRGFWDEDLWEKFLQQDHEFLEAYADFSAHPWEEGVIEPKVKEFIYIALDIGTPHFFIVGLGPHIQNALDHGASPEEIMEVFELHFDNGLQTIEIGMPILVDEAKKQGLLPNE